MKVVEKLKALAIPVSTTAMLVVPTICAYASESGAADSIDLATITNDAISQVKGDMLLVIAATTGAAVALVGITVGVSFLIKKLKGLKQNA